MDINKHPTVREVVEASVGDNPGIQVRLEHAYQVPVAKVWKALTDPARLARWFLPVSGELRPAGAFQFEGGVGGTILDCEPDTLLRATLGSDASIIEVRLQAHGSGATEFTFAHTVPLSTVGNGAGILEVAPAWDLSVVGLGLFLRAEFVNDPIAWASTPAMQRYARQSIDAWAAAIELSELATATEIAGATGTSITRFAPDAA